MNVGNQNTALLGSSAAVERVRLQIQRFAPHFRTMLLVGEQGAGKQSVARELHRQSPLAAEPFCSLTLEDFLAGIGCGKVIYLRGLSEIKADLHEPLVARLNALGRETRLLVACEGEPRALQAAGRLHTEVLARIGMLEIRIPPLRERLDDLAALTAAMLDDLACPARWTPADLTAATLHRWPGNLSELRAACERFATTGLLGFTPIAPAGGQPAGQLEEVRLEQVISRHVMDVLERCAGNKLKAAELLGISRSTLYRMLESAA